jgi:hypothetical protein
VFAGPSERARIKLGTIRREHSGVDRTGVVDRNERRAGRRRRTGDRVSYADVQAEAELVRADAVRRQEAAGSDCAEQYGERE